MSISRLGLLGRWLCRTIFTRNYDNISRHLAMSLDGSTDPGQIGLSHLQALATGLKINPRMVVTTAIPLCDLIGDAIPEAIQSFEDQYGLSPVTERIPLIIRKQVRRLHHQLKA